MSTEEKEAAELLSELIDTADEATIVGEDEDGNRTELDLKTGQVTEGDSQ